MPARAYAATSTRKGSTRARAAAAATPAKIQVNVDVNEFTWNEMVQLEELAGMQVDEMFRPSLLRDGDGNPVLDGKGAEQWQVKPSARIVLCLITVVMRRTRGRQLSLEEAGDVPVSLVAIKAPRKPTTAE